MSAVPLIQFTPEGLIIPTESAILQGTQEDIQASFSLVGAELNPSIDTPQGQICTTQTAIIGNSNDLFAYFVNGINPLYSSGFMQDAIGLIYFIKRKPALPTVVLCELIGVPGTIIPIGALAFDTNNNEYICTNSIIIDNNGIGITTFANVINGPIGCPANTLIKVGQTIIGWDAINNPNNGALGRDVENSIDFEYRRQQSVAKNAHGSPESIKGEILSVKDVKDCYVIDNPLGIMVLSGETNYPLKPHSVYISVTGGNSNEIATAIWNKKDLGCDYNDNIGVGATPISVTIFDTKNYQPPYPSYEVTYLIPDPTEIYFVVTIKNNGLLPSNIVSSIKNSIISTFNGNSGISPARIGSEIAASNYYCGIVALSPYITILSLTIGKTIAPIETNIIMGIDQEPVTGLNNIIVILT